MARWREVESGADPSKVGCHGRPLFAGKDLFWLDPATMFLMPPAHALLYVSDWRMSLTCEACTP